MILHTILLLCNSLRHENKVYYVFPVELVTNVVFSLCSGITSKILHNISHRSLCHSLTHSVANLLSKWTENPSLLYFYLTRPLSYLVCLGTSRMNKSCCFWKITLLSDKKWVTKDFNKVQKKWSTVDKATKSGKNPEKVMKSKERYKVQRKLLH